MLIINELALLKAVLVYQKELGRSIGFVPTMGALHAGHLALIEQSRKNCDISICSIFVNPTQFNESSDLEKYPRTPDKDIKALEQAYCDILFMPTVSAVYPPEVNNELNIPLNGLDELMEGAHRPGHFAGVVQVVSRLLDIVEPDQLFMGQKDYQQFAIIRHMINVQQRPVKIQMVATVREPDGLAMSSRNVRLSPEFRKKAPILYETLNDAKRKFYEQSIAQNEAEAIAKINAQGLETEYFSIVNGQTLQVFSEGEKMHSVVACVAAWAGDVRLIDNLIIR